MASNVGFDCRSDHKEITDHSADSQQSGYSQREFHFIHTKQQKKKGTASEPAPCILTQRYDMWLNIVCLIPQLEVGSSQARVPSAPAAALRSSAAQRATPPAPTASATPAWGATGRPRTPATTPTAPPAQVRHAQTWSSACQGSKINKRTDIKLCCVHHYYFFFRQLHGQHFWDSALSWQLVCSSDPQLHRHGHSVPHHQLHV